MAYSREEIEGALADAIKEGRPDVAEALAAELDRYGPANVGGRPSPSAAGGFHFGMKDVKDFAQGVIGGTIAMPGNVASMIPEQFNQRGPLSEVAKFNSPAILNFLKNIGVDLTTEKAPGGTADAFKESALQGAGGMALGPAGLGRNMATRAASRLAIGAVSGAAGEAGRTATSMPIGGTAAEILAQAIPLYMMGKTPNAIKALRPELRDLEEQLPAAQARTNKNTNIIGKQGIITQGLEDPSTFESVAEYLSTTPEGAPLRKVLADQLKAALAKGKTLIDEQSGLPFTQKTQGQVAQAWQDAINKPYEWRTERTRPAYQAAENIDAPGLGKILQNKLEQKRAAMNLSANSEAGRAMQTLGQKLAMDQEPTVLGLAGIAREAIEAGSKAKNPNLTPMQELEAKAQGVAGGVAKSAIKDYSPEFAAADAQHRLYSGPADEMKKSVMPGMLPVGRNATIGDFQKIFSSDVPPDQIRYVARNLTAADPQAFGAILKKHWEDAWEGAISGARTPQEATAKWAIDVAGVAGTRARDRAIAAVEENARAQGRNAVKAGQDANELFDALIQVARSRRGLGGVDIREYERNAAANVGSSFLRTPTLFTGGSPWAAGLDRFVAGKTNKQLIDLLTTNPDAAGKLAEFIRHVPIERKGQALLTSLMGMAGEQGQ